MYSVDAILIWDQYHVTKFEYENFKCLIVFLDPENLGLDTKHRRFGHFLTILW